MGKILTGLKELGSKMTGSEIASNRIGDAIREIASKYTGGGGGGGMTIINGTFGADDTVILDKTREEILEIFPNCIIKVQEGSELLPNYMIYTPAYASLWNGVPQFYHLHFDISECYVMGDVINVTNDGVQHHSCGWTVNA